MRISGTRPDQYTWPVTGEEHRKLMKALGAAFGHSSPSAAERYVRTIDQLPRDPLSMERFAREMKAFHIWLQLLTNPKRMHEIMVVGGDTGVEDSVADMAPGLLKQASDLSCPDFLNTHLAALDANLRSLNR
ncbi:hypothetical protein AWB71_02879 [Caballeronia peredens]|nr:hypothetical protein AWB71_02879 [Caballeronia peredens]